MQKVAGSSHTLVILSSFFDSVQDTFDVLTQDCVLKVMDMLLLYILKNFIKADTGFNLHLTSRF